MNEIVQMPLDGNYDGHEVRQEWTIAVPTVDGWRVLNRRAGLDGSLSAARKRCSDMLLNNSPEMVLQYKLDKAVPALIYVWANSGDPVSLFFRAVPRRLMGGES